MEDAPPKRNEENNIQAFVYEDSENLYAVDFLKNNDYIVIKCSHTSIDIDIKYSYKLYEDEIKKTTSCKSISNFLSKIGKFKNEMKIEKTENFILLHILLDNYKKEIKTVKLEEGYEEEEELDGKINNLEDAIKMIKILIQENKKLKNKLKSIENKFKEYKNKMELNFAYNSLDINSYKLDNIFKTLPCKDIIQNRDEFGLINLGFQHLFKKNIIFFECIYKSIKKEYDCMELKNMLNTHQFLVIVILTKDKKRFGAFFENDINNEMNNMNNVNNNMNNVNNNNINNVNMNNMNNVNMNNMNIMNMNNINKVNVNNNNINKNNNIFDNILDNILDNMNMNNNMILNNTKYNMNMNNNMNNNNMNSMNIGNSPEETIFNSSLCLKDYFVFSLDNLQIFYSNNQENKVIPNFFILYDINRQSLYGREFQNNQNMNINQYKLSNKQEFNVKDFELYNVEFGKL